MVLKGTLLNWFCNFLSSSDGQGFINALESNNETETKQL